MTKPNSLRAPLLRMTMTAALLAVPAVAFGQSTSSPTTNPGATSGTIPGATTGSMPARQGDAMPGAAATAPTTTPGTGGRNLPATTPGAPTLATPGASGMPNTSPTLTTPGATTGSTGSSTMPSSTITSMPGAASPRARMSEVIGSAIYNDRDEKIGEVDDVLAESGTGATGPMAVVQVGGFLGLGGRLVTVPLRDLRWNAERERLVLPGASKEALQSRPAFEYAARRG